MSSSLASPSLPGPSGSERSFTYCGGDFSVVLTEWDKCCILTVQRLLTLEVPVIDPILELAITLAKRLPQANQNAVGRLLLAEVAEHEYPAHPTRLPSYPSGRIVPTQG